MLITEYPGTLLKIALYIYMENNNGDKMKVKTNNNGMKQLKDLGFKKIKTEPGFHMYELTPARLNSFDSNFRAQVPIKKKVKR